MAQISKIRLRKEIEERIFEVFYESLATRKTKGEVEKLLKDLLTPTEKVMLAKRLSIALLLLQDYNYRSIRELLKVSFSTINRVSVWLKIEGVGFRETLEKLKKKDYWRKLLYDLAEFSAKTEPSA